MRAGDGASALHERVGPVVAATRPSEGTGRICCTGGEPPALITTLAVGRRGRASEVAGEPFAAAPTRTERGDAVRVPLDGDGTGGAPTPAEAAG